MKKNWIYSDYQNNKKVKLKKNRKYLLKKKKNQANLDALSKFSLI